MSLYWRTTAQLLATLLGVLLIFFASRIVLNEILRPQLFGELLQQQIERFDQELVRHPGIPPGQLAWSDGIRIRPATPRSFDRNRRHMAADPLARALSQRLGGRPIHLLRRHGDIPTIGVGVDFRGRAYWLFVPVDDTDPERQSWWWLTIGGLALMLVIGVSLWMTGWITRSLTALTRAAATLEQGRIPPPLNERGPREVRAVTRQFNRMTQAQAAQLREQEFLLGAVSHDLRTPLARMRIELAMLEDERLKAGLSADVDQMQAIIEQFLDYVRSGGETKSDALALDEFLAGLIADHQRSGLEIQGHWRDMGPIDADALILRRVLDNLIVNAGHHGRPPIELRASRQGNRVTLKVCDRGPGIAADDRERLTQPFQTGNQARGSSNRSGLGLAIVKRGIQTLGGSMHFEQDGTGFCVVLHLPAHRAGQQQPPASMTTPS